MKNKIEKLKKYYGGDDLAARVLADKYLLPSESTPEELWDRLAKAVSDVDGDYGTLLEQRAKLLKTSISACSFGVEEYENEKAIRKATFYNLLSDFKFIPGGRIMYALGREEKVSCTNCYVIPIKEDSIEGIYEWLKESALTYRATGGVGTDISILRPKGAKVKNSGGASPGACSFMDLMSQSTNTVHQKLRRGALMMVTTTFISWWSTQTYLFNLLMSFWRR